MSFPRYPEYKDSGVAWLGEVPERWEVRRLKALLVEVDERVEDQDIELLGLSKLLGVVKRSELEQGASESDNYAKYKVANEGQLVMNKMQAWNGVFGLCPIRGMVSPDYAVFRFIVDEYDNFLAMLFRTEIMAGVFFTRCRGMGTAFLRINTPDFLDIKVPLPPIEDVRCISQFLACETAKIDALVAEQERLIALLKEKRQAVISHAVTKGLNPDAPMKDSGIEWLGEVPEHWEVKRLKFLCDVQTGDKDTVDAVDDGQYPFYVRSQTIERIGSFTFDCEAVLTAGDGAGVGKVFHYVNGKFDFHQRVYMMNNFRWVKGWFFFQYLAALFYMVALDGGAKSTVDSLRMPLFMNFVLTVPPLDEQDEVVSFIERETAKFDALTAEANRAIGLLKERRSALISAAVTGKIDVRGYVASAARREERVGELA